MTLRISKFLLAIIFTSLLGCQDDEEVSTKETAYDLQGYVQKGPFINGTAITVSELNQKLIATGKNFTTQIIDNKGSFSLKDITLQSNFVQLIAEGFYFDEVRGEKSAAQLTLFALADVFNVSSVNVNLLSHLEKDRVIYLMQEEEKSFTTAKKQAQQEILAIFGIEKTDMTTSELLDISQDGDDNAILLAVSAILQGNNTVAELSELLADIITDIREDGVLNSESTQEKIRVNAMSLTLADIRQHLEVRYEELGVDATIPNFEQYIDSDGDGFLNKDEDDTPDDFAFEAQVDVAINDTLTSNAITITGLKEDGIAVASVANEWLLVNGQLITNSTAEVKNGDELQIKLISSSRYADTVKASLTVGMLTRTFQVVTDDYIPDAFNFTPLIDVAVDSIYSSDTIIVSGLPHPTPTTVTDGMLIKNGEITSGDTVLVKNGDKLVLQLRSSSDYAAISQASLNINEIWVDFKITTDDYAPDEFSFSTLENADRATWFSSDTITLTGLKYPSPVTITGTSGVLFINGKEVSNTGNLASDGDQVMIQVFSGYDYEKSQSSEITIGSFTATFTVITKANHWQRKAVFPEKWVDPPFIAFATEDQLFASAANISNNMSKKLYVYDMQSDQWSSKDDMPSEPYNTTAIGVIGKKSYLPLKSGFWEYNIETNSWTQMASPTESLANLKFGFTIDSHIYFLGNSNVWMYDPALNSWTQKASFPFSYQYYYTAFSVDGSIFINQPEGWMYDPTNNTWTRKKDNETPNAEHAFTTQNIAYSIGWDSGRFDNSTHTYSYDKNTDTWELLDASTDMTDFIKTISSPNNGYYIYMGRLYKFTPPQE